MQICLENTGFIFLQKKHEPIYIMAIPNQIVPVAQNRIRNWNPKAEGYELSQFLACERMASSCTNQKSMLMLHAVGSGKSLTSLCVAFNVPEDKKISIITINGLETAFSGEYGTIASFYGEEKTNAVLGVTVAPDGKKQFDFVRLFYEDLFAKLIGLDLKDPNTVAFVEKHFKDKVLIIDEAHKILQFLNRDRTGSFEANMFRCFNMCHKVIFLTATPIQKDWSDFGKMIKIIAKLNDPTKFNTFRCYNERAFKKEFWFGFDESARKKDLYINLFFHEWYKMKDYINQKQSRFRNSTGDELNDRFNFGLTRILSWVAYLIKYLLIGTGKLIGKAAKAVVWAAKALGRKIGQWVSGAAHGAMSIGGKLFRGIESLFASLWGKVQVLWRKAKNVVTRRRVYQLLALIAVAIALFSIFKLSNQADAGQSVAPGFVNVHPAQPAYGTALNFGPNVPNVPIEANYVLPVQSQPGSSWSQGFWYLIHPFNTALKRAGIDVAKLAVLPQALLQVIGGITMVLDYIKPMFTGVGPDMYPMDVDEFTKLCSPYISFNDYNNVENAHKEKLDSIDLEINEKSELKSATKEHLDNQESLFFNELHPQIENADQQKELNRKYSRAHYINYIKSLPTPQQQIIINDLKSYEDNLARFPVANIINKPVPYSSSQKTIRMLHNHKAFVPTMAELYYSNRIRVNFIFDKISGNHSIEFLDTSFIENFSAEAMFSAMRCIGNYSEECLFYMPIVYDNYLSTIPEAKRSEYPSDLYKYTYFPFELPDNLLLQIHGKQRYEEFKNAIQTKTIPEDRPATVIGDTPEIPESDGEEDELLGHTEEETEEETKQGGGGIVDSWKTMSTEGIIQKYSENTLQEMRRTYISNPNNTIFKQYMSEYNYFHSEKGQKEFQTLVNIRQERKMQKMQKKSTTPLQIATPINGMSVSGISTPLSLGSENTLTLLGDGTPLSLGSENTLTLLGNGTPRSLGSENALSTAPVEEVSESSRMLYIQDFHKKYDQELQEKIQTQQKFVSEGRIPKIQNTRMFSCEKFEEAMQIIEAARKQFYYLPVVYSNFEENGLYRFSAYLSSMRLPHIMITPESLKDDGYEAMIRSQRAYFKWPFSNSINDSRLAFVENPDDPLFLLSDYVIHNQPCCILVHSSLQEGLSLVKNEVMICLETMISYGNQEQVYGRVIRSYSHKEKNNYEYSQKLYNGDYDTLFNTVLMLNDADKLIEKGEYITLINISKPVISNTTNTLLQALQKIVNSDKTIQTTNVLTKFNEYFTSNKTDPLLNELQLFVDFITNDVGNEFFVKEEIIDKVRIRKLEIINYHEGKGSIIKDYLDVKRNIIKLHGTAYTNMAYFINDMNNYNAICNRNDSDYFKVESEYLPIVYPSNMILESRKHKYIYQIYSSTELQSKYKTIIFNPQEQFSDMFNKDIRDLRNRLSPQLIEEINGYIQRIPGPEPSAFCKVNMYDDRDEKTLNRLEIAIKRMRNFVHDRTFIKNYLWVHTEFFKPQFYLEIVDMLILNKALESRMSYDPQKLSELRKRGLITDGLGDVSPETWCISKIALQQLEINKLRKNFSNMDDAKLDLLYPTIPEGQMDHFKGQRMQCDKPSSPCKVLTKKDKGQGVANSCAPKQTRVGGRRKRFNKTYRKKRYVGGENPLIALGNNYNQSLIVKNEEILSELIQMSEKAEMQPNESGCDEKVTPDSVVFYQILLPLIQYSESDPITQLDMFASSLITPELLEDYKDELFDFEYSNMNNALLLKNIEPSVKLSKDQLLMIEDALNARGSNTKKPNNNYGDNLRRLYNESNNTANQQRVNQQYSSNNINESSVFNGLNNNM
jgi:hypothetical protein